MASLFRHVFGFQVVQKVDVVKPTNKSVTENTIMCAVKRRETWKRPEKGDIDIGSDRRKVI